jgi:5,6-dimethylbenzimidazole synthase
MPTAQQAIYDVIRGRRDVRRFRTEVVPEEVLYRLLEAAHHGPSVGFMQPWNFIVVQDATIKERVKGAFEEAHAVAAEHYTGSRRVLYDSLKLEGILEAPINLCITCDRERAGPHVLGRHTIQDTDLYSTCCAVQNLWLAAHAEGIGVGWVSIVELAQLRTILQIPAHVVPVAYLCVGYPRVQFPKPELELVGWEPRLSLVDLIYRDQWGASRNAVAPASDASPAPGEAA